MATDYIKRIDDMGRGHLIDLWDQIKSRNTPGWPDGRALELLVLKAFKLEHADVTWPYPVKIGKDTVEQIDGFVSVPGISVMVETKDYSDPINVDPIAKLRNQLARRQAGLLGCVFSFEGFTDPAIILATYCAPQGIILWKGTELDIALREESMVETLRKKHARLLQQGVPDYDITVERRR